MGKAKGSVVLSAVKLLRGQKDAARRALPATLHKYLEERVVVAAWYPEEDLFGLIVGCAATFPGESDSLFEKMGAATARFHLENGIYTELMKRDANSRARIVWRAQHDTGDMAVIEETPTSMTYELTGWEHASAKYCRVVGGYFAEVSRLAGAAKPTVTHPTCRSVKGDRCVYLVSWG